MLKTIALPLSMFALLALQFISLGVAALNGYAMPDYLAWFTVVEGMLLLVLIVHVIVCFAGQPALEIDNRQSASATIDDDDDEHLGVGA